MKTLESVFDINKDEFAIFSYYLEKLKSAIKEGSVKQDRSILNIIKHDAWFHLNQKLIDLMVDTCSCNICKVIRFSGGLVDNDFTKGYNSLDFKGLNIEMDTQLQFKQFNKNCTIKNANITCENWTIELEGVSLENVNIYYKDTPHAWTKFCIKGPMIHTKNCNITCNTITFKYMDGNYKMQSTDKKDYAKEIEELLELKNSKDFRYNRLEIEVKVRQPSGRYEGVLLVFNQRGGHLK